jgi:hypothetical protein
MTFRGALADSSKAIDLAPDWDEVFKSYVTRGLARAMLGDNSGALADLDRAAALNPGEPAILLNGARSGSTQATKPAAAKISAKRSSAAGRTPARCWRRVAADRPRNVGRSTRSQFGLHLACQPSVSERHSTMRRGVFRTAAVARALPRQSRRWR